MARHKSHPKHEKHRAVKTRVNGKVVKAKLLKRRKARML